MLSRSLPTPPVVSNNPQDDQARHTSFEIFSRRSTAGLTLNVVSTFYPMRSRAACEGASVSVTHLLFTPVQMRFLIAASSENYLHYQVCETANCGPQ
ncbi:hypothetical protein MFFC18_09640 [Mariniblastus fucicola]|uniref:Uncharacterized protein n=1 Tax=Mariniblastus fucicola TaxID=980251 RepID=A0A5B9PDK2_9BACT|nr:hypothetical protein MFFC18_09640 [Mariniblastus fucicola]